MQDYLDINLNILDGIKAQVWKIKNSMRDELKVTGINIFTGPQGSGKRLS